MHAEPSAVHSLKTTLSHKEFSILELSMLEFDQECLISITFPPCHGHLMLTQCFIILLAKHFLPRLKGRNEVCGGRDF